MTEEPRLALFNFAPQFCPLCGERLLWLSEPEGRREYRASVSMYCAKCGLRYQLVRTGIMLTAASDSGGDLGQYASWRLPVAA